MSTSKLSEQSYVSLGLLSALLGAVLFGGIAYGRLDTRVATTEKKTDVIERMQDDLATVKSDSAASREDLKVIKRFLFENPRHR